MSYYASSSTLRKEESYTSRLKDREEPMLYSRYGSQNQQSQMRQQISSSKRQVQVSTSRLNQIPSTRQIPTHRQAILQQEQINDLQRKIDLILMHNEKLQSQKQRYRLLYQQLQADYNQKIQQSNTARFMNEQNSIMVQKLRNQLQLSVKTYQQKLNDAFQSRKMMKQQIQTLSKIIEQVNRENKSLKLQLKEHSLKIDSLTFQLKEQFIRQQAELQNKLRDEFLIREIQLKNQRKQLIQTYENQLTQTKKLMEKQMNQLINKNNQQIERIHEQFEEEKKDLIRQLKEEAQKEIEQINLQHHQEIKRQKDQAIQFINQNIENIQSQDEIIKTQYEEEISRLKESLQMRKQLIDSLLNQSANKSNQSDIQPSLEIDNSWLPELLALKEQFAQQTNQYLQESELLKLKLTEKFQLDIHSLKNIYENKIQLQALHNQTLQKDNQRLRTMYEQSLEDNIKAKKDYELQKSKLKNVIRKLNLQLKGVQQEFKLNIEGVRDMNNTFSMTMMKSMIEVRQKASFFTEENRKLRKAYDEHESQMVIVQRQADQKVAYYQQKYEQQRQKYSRIIEQLKEQLQLTQQQGEERQTQLRDNLNKQHEMIHNVVQTMRQDTHKLQEENKQLNRKCHELSSQFKDKQYEITHLRSLVSQLQADVERLKLDLSTGGTQEKNQTDTLNQWKYHYESTIAQLNQQIQILQSKLNTKNEQLLQVVKKYQLLEQDLNKILKTVKKKSSLQKKVMEIGLDNNLVQNLAQIFTKQNKQNILQEEN